MARSPVTAHSQAVDLASQLAHAAASKLATDISALDVSATLAITDVFLLVTAGNQRQLDSIIDAIADRAGELGFSSARREGEHGGHWILLDLGDVVVHVMSEEARALYTLERLWKDAPRLALTAN